MDQILPGKINVLIFGEKVDLNLVNDDKVGQYAKTFIATDALKEGLDVLVSQ
jgi:hypothetical protein